MVAIVARQCFEYSGDISTCLEVIRPDFSPCKKVKHSERSEKQTPTVSGSVAQHFYTNSPYSIWTGFSLFLQAQKYKTVSNALKGRDYALCNVWCIGKP